MHTEKVSLAKSKKCQIFHSLETMLHTKRQNLDERDSMCRTRTACFESWLPTAHSLPPYTQ